MATGRRLAADLTASYEFCRALHRAHGRTYYLATKLLPAWKRPHVHALYGFTRYTDDIVDRLDRTHQASRAALLTRWEARFAAAMDGAPDQHPIFPAVRHTIETFRLDRADFTAFFRSMELDLSVTGYPSYDDLLGYMAGSAAAIGTMMLPILGAPDLVAAREPARQLGLAFQLTNFIRDVGEDLDRGRIYLPGKDLAEFGVTPDDLRARAATPAVRALIAFEVDRARRHYTLAAPGIALLDRSSQPCIRTAYRAYGAILDEVVRADYDVFRQRATVSTPRKLGLVVASLLTPPGRAERTVPGGSRFVYVLPDDPYRALVELTGFVPSQVRPPTGAQRRDALAGYLSEVLHAKDFEVVRTESAVLPLRTRPGPRGHGRVLRIGAAAGLVKASTGYAYQRIQRDSAAIARSLARYGHPFATPAPPRRYRLLDAVLLDVLDADPAALELAFATLFRAFPAEFVLRFLDEDSAVRDDLRLMASLPPLPYLHALVRLRSRVQR